MQARLRELTSKVLPLTLAGGAAVTGLALLRRASLRQAVADGVAIAVAAVPEGLPLVATLSQLAAAQRLSTRGVLVRAPRTIEALGRVDTICFDKTGTLTENRLRVVHSVPAATDRTALPRRHRSGGRPRSAGRRAARPPSRTRARDMPRHRRGDPQRGGFTKVKVIRSGTCSRKSRSSPAVASPPRSARSARIRQSLC